MIDTHAHLGADAAEVVARAHEVGVTRIVDVATTVAGARVSLARARALSGVRVVLGIHPHEAGGADEAAGLVELRGLLADPLAVGVGETGLDYFRAYAPRDAQTRLFDAQLALARELRKPVVVHTRDADADTLARLVRHAGPVVLHCFSSPALLAPALEHGWYVSFAGNVTYKNADALRAAARAVPDRRLLAETDSPYLAPQPVRGRRNEPANVLHTLAVLAELRGIPVDEAEQLIEANAARVFALSSGAP